MEIFRPGKAKVEDSPSGPFGPAWQFPIATLIGVLCVACGGPGSSGSADVLGSRVATIPTPKPGLDTWAARFSPNGTEIVLGYYYQLDVWDWRTKKKLATLDLPKGADPISLVNPVDFSTDGRYLAVGTPGADTPIRIFNTKDLSLAADVQNPSTVRVAEFKFVPGGSQLIFTMDEKGPDANLFAYDVQSQQLNWSFPLPKFAPSSMSVSPNGRWVVVEGSDFSAPPPANADADQPGKLQFARLQMWVIQLPERTVFKMIGPHVSGKLGWSTDGIRLAIAGAGATEILTFPSGESLDIDRKSGAGHMSASFSPDGRYFIEGDMNGKGTGQGLFIWDTARKHLIEHAPGNISSIDMTLDSRFLAVGGRDKTTIYPLK